MPALSADWPEVKATAIHLGSLKEAAKAHGVSYGAAKARACREKWPIGQRPAKQLAEAKVTAHRQMVTAGGVTSVTSASEAALSVLAEDERETRLSLSKTARRLAKESEVTPIVMETPADVLAVAKLYAVTHRIDAQEGKGTPTITLNVGFLLDCQAPDPAVEQKCIDVEQA